MTGRELIEWIQHNHAEDLECVVQYRDGGGDYYGGEIVDAPVFAFHKRDADNNFYNVDITYSSGRTPNCFVV